MNYKSADQRLQQVVDAYGADPRRWPENEQQALKEVALSNTGADWMAQARTLDRALDRGAHDADLKRIDPDLSGAIIAQAETTPQFNVEGQADDGRLTDISMTPPPAATPGPGRFAGFTDHLPEAAILAASLLLGFWAGGLDVIDTEILEFSRVAGLSVSSEEETNFISALVGIDLVEDEDQF